MTSYNVEKRNVYIGKITIIVIVRRTLLLQFVNLNFENIIRGKRRFKSPQLLVVTTGGQ